MTPRKSEAADELERLSGFYSKRAAKLRADAAALPRMAPLSMAYRYEAIGYEDVARNMKRRARRLRRGR